MTRIGMAILSVIFIQASPLIQALGGRSLQALILFGSVVLLFYVTFFRKKLFFSGRDILFIFVAGICFSYFELIATVVHNEPNALVSNVHRGLCFFLLFSGFLIGKDRAKGSIVLSSKDVYVIFSLLLIISIFYILSLGGMSGRAIGRVRVGDDFSAIGAAFSLSILAAISFSIFMTTRLYKERLLSFLSFILFLVGAIATASRGPIVALFFLVVATLYVSFVSEVNFYRKSKKIVAVFLSLLAFCAIVVFNDFVYSQVSLLIERFSSALNGGQDFSLGEREDTIYKYISNIGEFFAFGYPGYSGQYPHNIFLDFFVRFGLLGAVFAVYLYVKTIAISLNIKKLFHSTSLYLVLSGFIFTFILSQISLTSEYLKVYWFAFGFFHSYKFQEANATPVVSRATE